MRKISLIAIFIAAVAAALASEPAEYKLQVQDFGELVVVDGVPVDYSSKPDSAGWAVFSCVPEIAAEIIFSNENSRLTIRTSAEEDPIIGVPRVKVYSSALHKVENSGDSLLRVFMSVPTPQFKARQIDNGTIEVHSLDTKELDAAVTAGKGSLLIDGKATNAKINNVSSGLVQTSGLAATNMSCYIFGSGNIECSPTEALRVYGAGHGSVIYHGNPKVTKRGIGIKVIHADSHDTASIR